MTVHTTCPYCGVGCGILASPDGRGGVHVAGDPDHPANFGRLCSKGSALGETLGLAGRLLAPRVAGRDVGWDDALDLVAATFSDTIARHGPDSVAFYLSGQMLTEDYYVANKLMKGFIGSANIDTNSRLCMASSVAGHRRAFGSDTVPGLYEDLEAADLVVLTGSNLAWCHPVLWQRLQAARVVRPAMKLVVIDPRRTVTADAADLHLALAPGSDAALFNALLVAIADRGAASRTYLGHVAGYDAALAAARASDPAATELSAKAIRAFTDLWIGTEKVVTVYSQGINQSASGTDKVNAILNCHLATGRIGRPGMGPFSVTGQPNAMGGREVGGMANMLACHLEIDNPGHRAAVQGFWNAPRMATQSGLKAVDMFRAVETGQIKALWIIHTNPAVTLPEADRVRAAIAGCDFTVVSDITAETDTARLADVLLPATAWAEKSGTVTNSERRISRQRAVLPAPGLARDDWRILAGVAQRMGWADAFGWPDAAAVFAEHAGLSGVAGALGSDFDISDHAAITTAAYDRLDPFLWPASPARQGGRFFGDGRFHTPDGRARMLPITPRMPVAAPDASHPFRLNTGRVRDHWHTMTRTALSPRLNVHLAEPFLEIHPTDAARLTLGPATLACVTNPFGRALLRVLITDRVRPGEVFAPMHWTGETAPTGRIDALVPGVVDPVSGQPESKAAVVAVAPWDAAWYGFAVSANPLHPDCGYHALARTATGWRAELAGQTTPADWRTAAAALFAVPAETDCLIMTDPARGLHRFAFLKDGRLIAALFVAPEPVAVARAHLAALPGGAAEPGLLSGRPPGAQSDAGPTICACFNVGLATIRRAIADRGLADVAAIGAALQAGTGCGACRADLAALIPAQRLEAAE